MKYELRNERYVLDFCKVNGIDDQSSTQKEVEALKNFLEQFNDISIALILVNLFDHEINEEDNPSRKELVDAFCNYYIDEKEMTVDCDFKSFLDEVVSFVVDKFDAYGLDYPDEFVE